MLKLTLFCLALSTIGVHSINNDWWKNAVVYQIYPRSFKDSNGDGIGDLNGITSKMEHIKDIGADALWLSPIYTSPQADFGYDIANFTDVDPGYGTLDDFDKLVTKAKSLGLKVILDFVPNHSSNEHQWFKDSVNRVKPYDEYYVWRDGKMVNGVRQPPNNWLCNFKGSAWEWNDQRQQYYLHQFAIGQPDLNYRSSLLQQAMKDVLTFWMNRGVDGFRIDVINHVIEDILMRDEPPSNDPTVPADDYNSLIHIYTRDQSESYDILHSWRILLDEFATQHQTDGKFLITEAYTTLPLSFKYFSAGSNPFNFMFITDLNGASKATDFKRKIDAWMNGLPRGNVSNWVIGNHDNHRIASRYGVKKADLVSMLATVLPEITVAYNGDEIGMIDRNFTWEETLDVAGCNLGADRYQIGSRDPERTPFQWDSTTSAGFSSNEKTWLPVNDNYKTLNLEAQKAADVSHYKVFKALTTLKKKLLSTGEGKTDVILITQDVFGIVRRLKKGTSPVALVINTSDREVKVDAMSWLNIPLEMFAYATSVASEISSGVQIETNSLQLPGSASIVLVSQNQLNELMSDL